MIILFSNVKLKMENGESVILTSANN